MSIVNVNCDNLENNPSCAHGPTLKFSRLVKEKIKSFFACSACRDRKECPFFLWEDEKFTPSKQLAYEDWKQRNFPKINPSLLSSRLESFRSVVSKKYYCLKCFDFVFPDDLPEHQSHPLKIVSNADLCAPSKILMPLENDKNQAQYWFSKKSVEFLVSNIVSQSCLRTLCIGCPTIHETLRSRSVKCLLLDIDHRYHWFYSQDDFIWFNMFNFFFISQNTCSSSVLEAFLKRSSTLVIIDPPFGARIEPLKRTIDELEKLSEAELKIILVMPYFMEPRVLKAFPQFQMLDFPVEYINHKKFKNRESAGKDSPVRIFTNIIPKKFIFPENEGYHFCKKCEAWRSRLNVHCDSCETCPSKNGDSYRHCSTCGICVKQTWKHCGPCGKCALPDHPCQISKKEAKFQNKKKKLK